MDRHAQYNIIKVIAQAGNEVVVLEDLGPWNIYPTITNDSEYVKEQIEKQFGISKAVLYYDSEGELSFL